MDKVSASQPRDRGFEPHTGHDHDTSYDTLVGSRKQTQEWLSCYNLFHNRANINTKYVETNSRLFLRSGKKSLKEIDTVYLYIYRYIQQY